MKACNIEHCFFENREGSLIQEKDSETQYRKNQKVTT